MWLFETQRLERSLHRTRAALATALVRTVRALHLTRTLRHSLNSGAGP